MRNIDFDATLRKKETPIKRVPGNGFGTHFGKA